MGVPKSPTAITAAGPGATQELTGTAEKEQREAPVSAHHFVDPCGLTAFCQKTAAKGASERPASAGRQHGERSRRALGRCGLGSHNRKVIPLLSPGLHLC